MTAPPRVALAAAVVAVVVGIGATIAVVGRAGADEQIEVAVRDFFAARRDGDCHRLVDLVSEDSWSRGGRLDRDGFVEACTDVVEHFRPELGGVEVVRHEGGRAVVAVAVPFDPATAVLPGQEDGLVVDDGSPPGEVTYSTGTLVHEGGGWRIETDQALLRIGRSPTDTLRRYLEARADADCDAVADLLTEAARSAAGAGSRDELVERCAATTAPDPRLQPGLVPALPFTVAERDGQITAVAETPAGPEQPGETITLVEDDLVWKLDHDIEAVAYSRLRALVLDPPADGYTAGFEAPVQADLNDPYNTFDRYEGSDAARHRRTAGFARGTIVTFEQGDRDLDVLLYEFTGADGAGAYAEHLADRIGAIVDRRAPRPPFDGSFEIVVRCGESADCSHAEQALALASHDRFLVVVTAVDPAALPADQLLSRARQVLRAQIDHLEAQR